MLLSLPHPPAALRPLLKHQAEAEARMAGAEQLGIFWEMRLGKTLFTIRHVEALRLDGPVLVVAPLSVLGTWQDELDREGIPSALLDGKAEDRFTDIDAAREFDCRWFLVNYEGIISSGHRNARGKPMAVPSPLAQRDWAVVVLDESTRIRNPSAMATRIAQEWLARAPARFILSGMPCPEGPLDYFEQMRFLHGRFLGCANWWQFRNLSHEPGFTDWDWICKPHMHTVIRDAVHKNSLVLRRRDAGMGNRRIYQRRWCRLPGWLQVAYNRAEREFALGDAETNYHIVVNSWLHQLAGGFPKSQKGFDADHKADELFSLVEGELLRTPAIVWFRYNREIEMVSARLRKRGHRHHVMTGLVPPAKRWADVAAFQKGDGDLYLLQLACGKMGIDLSRADAAIYFSNSFEYEARAQSEARIEHPTKRNRPLLYIDLVTADTIDEDLCLALGQKDVTAKYFMRRVETNFRRRWEERHAA